VWLLLRLPETCCNTPTCQLDFQCVKLPTHTGCCCLCTLCLYALLDCSLFTAHDLQICPHWQAKAPDSANLQGPGTHTVALLHLTHHTACRRCAVPCPQQGTQHSTAQHSTAQHSTAQHSTAQHSTAQRSTGLPSQLCSTTHQRPTQGSVLPNPPALADPAQPPN
jgi:hypothetical protein